MKGVIYRLYNSEAQYFGSSQKDIKTIMKRHKDKFSSLIGTNVFYSSNILFMNDEMPKIEIVETFEFENILQLRSLEQKYITENDCVNVTKPTGLSRKEYEKDWYLKNKHKRPKETCECGSTYVKSNRKKHLKTQKHILKMKLLPCSALS